MAASANESIYILTSRRNSRSSVALPLKLYHYHRPPHKGARCSMGSCSPRQFISGHEAAPPPRFDYASPTILRPRQVTRLDAADTLAAEPPATRRSRRARCQSAFYDAFERFIDAFTIRPAARSRERPLRVRARAFSRSSSCSASSLVSQQSRPGEGEAKRHYRFKLPSMLIFADAADSLYTADMTVTMLPGTIYHTYITGRRIGPWHVISYYFRTSQAAGHYYQLVLSIA